MKMKMFRRNATKSIIAYIILLQVKINEVSSFSSINNNYNIPSKIINRNSKNGGYLQTLSSPSLTSLNINSVTTTTRTTTNMNNNRPKTTSQLHQFFSDDEIDQGPDRIKSCIPYILPLLDGDSFGKYIYQRIPPLGAIHDVVLAPLVSIMQAQPLLSLGLFVLLSFGTRNTDMSRFVRFNAQQAVLLDVALIFPTLIGESVSPTAATSGGGLFGGGGGSGAAGAASAAGAAVASNAPLIPTYLDEFGCNFVYYIYMTAIIYSVVSNLRGKKPNQIPYISQAAEYTTGPY